jgi:Flp pilus assembly protein protease CpaA
MLARDTLRLQLWSPSRRKGMLSATETVQRITAPVRSSVPYGVAIAAAGVVTLILNTSFAR